MDMTEAECQVFSVDQNGEEYILDISFRGVQMGNDSILKLAGRDV